MLLRGEVGILPVKLLRNKNGNYKKREQFTAYPIGIFEILKNYRKLHFQAFKRKLELGFMSEFFFLYITL